MTVMENYNMDITLPEDHISQKTDIQQDTLSKRGQSAIEVDQETGIMHSIEKSALHQDLQSRHMQMIAIGGAIGAGLFVGTGLALHTAGPGALIVAYMIVGFMLLMTMQALAELAVLYPVNGAFFTYAVRFIGPSWGFAVGWDYAIGFLAGLPFEITAAGLTIDFWRDDINIGVWIAVFLTILIIIQFFGVRGYGEVEFILSMIKVTACTGFIIFGIIVDCGGVPTDTRGYIGAKYWYHNGGAFQNGFKGFCAVFVNASFAFGGTELVGLAAAEAANPRKSIPLAAKQVFWRISFFYVVGLLILGLIVPSDSTVLLGATGSNTKASPFVLAIQLAGVKGLPSVFNAVITISVISVANSCTYGFTRTVQALAVHGMAPKVLGYIDKKGRPIWCVVIQIAFGLLAFANEAVGGEAFFTWLLALAGLGQFFIWGSICLSHIRFRKAWHVQGHSKSELPYQAAYGVWGSWIGLVLNILCIIATFYTALWSPGSSPNIVGFLESYLAAPLILALYLFWRVVNWDWKPFNRSHEMDLVSGLRGFLEFPDEESARGNRHWYYWPFDILRGLF